MSICLMLICQSTCYSIWKIFGKEDQKANTALFHIATLIAEVGYFINSDTWCLYFCTVLSICFISTVKESQLEKVKEGSSDLG